MKKFKRLLIKNGTLIDGETIRQGDILIEGEKIQDIAPHIDLPKENTTSIDAKGLYVLPGAIDAHTHMDLPLTSFTSKGIHSSDSFTSGSRAALFGGTTTIIDFANQTRGQSLSKALSAWKQRAAKKTYCDYSFHLSVTDTSNSTLGELAMMAKDEGITSFKIFTTYESMRLSWEQIEIILKRVRDIGGLVTIHAEEDTILREKKEELIREGKTSAAYHGEARPIEAEVRAVERIVSLAQEVGCPLYIVHLSCAQSLEIISHSEIKTPLLLETCPQYLMLDDSLYDPKKLIQSVRAIFSPAARPWIEKEGLWQGILQNKFHVLASDHCPFTTTQKKKGLKDFAQVPSGIPGVENRLEILHSEGVIKRGLSLENWVKLCCANPAKIFGLYPQKGSLEVGSDADLVLFDPNKEHKISAKTHHMKCDYSSYEGLKVQGKCQVVILRGQVAINKNKLKLPKGFGKLLKRKLFSSSLIP
ncbi:MAG: dihydropyrimidinase [Pseudomonadota bacterium]